MTTMCALPQATREIEDRDIYSLGECFNNAEQVGNVEDYFDLMNLTEMERKNVLSIVKNSPHEPQVPMTQCLKFWQRRNHPYYKHLFEILQNLGKAALVEGVTTFIRERYP